VREVLKNASNRIALIEKGEEAIFIVEARLEADPHSVRNEVKDLLSGAREEAQAAKKQLISVLSESVALLGRAKIPKKPEIL
jgi:hypothetical protein